MKSPAKIDLKGDEQELKAFLTEKSKHGFPEYAFMLADVLMEIPLGKPFGTFIPDDLIETAKKNLQEVRTLLKKARALGRWEEVVSLEKDIPFLEEVISEGKTGGRPVDKPTAIICLWAPLAERDGKTPWTMLVRLLRWFHERFSSMNYDYASKIEIRDDEANKIDGRQKFYWGKQFKKRCTIRYKTTESNNSKITKSKHAKLDKLLPDPKIMDSFLAWRDRDRKPNWKDKNIGTIVAYLRACVFKQTRKIYARSVYFSANSIEVEADIKNGGELKTVRMRRDLKTKEFTEVLLDPSEAREFGSVIFSE